MFLHMALLLAAASLLLEGLVAYRVAPYRHFVEKREYAAVFVSMAGSFFLGKIFGAEGLVCLMAGIMSTVASPPMYKLLGWYEVNRDEVNAKYYQFRQTMIDFGILVYKFLRLLTLPIRMIRWCVTQWETAKVKLVKEV